ncbi:MAG: SDR family oxidoreductase [Proteobacteria bacterium]|nr:SDR family oxidoreductase [Pseudomonadota bacterium]
MDRLKDKIAVITGAASGIGLGTVELFVAEGAKVIAADVQDDKGKDLERRFNGQVKFVHCDVTKEEDIQATMQAAKDNFGGLDILFNNAGAGGAPNTIEDMTGEAWDRTMGLLLRSVALGMRYAIPFIKERDGGSIINTASVAALSAGMGPIAYSTAKAGVVHLTTVAAAQLGRSKIRVNAICPGFIRTEIFAAGMRAAGMNEQMATMVTKGMFEQQADAQPIPKPGLPEDIANMCLFFASDESKFVTGTHIQVDGGLTVGPRHSWDPEEQQRRMAMRAQAMQAKS